MPQSSSSRHGRKSHDSSDISMKNGRMIHNPPRFTSSCTSTKGSRGGEEDCSSSEDEVMALINKLQEETTFVSSSKKSAKGYCVPLECRNITSSGNNSQEIGPQGELIEHVPAPKQQRILRRNSNASKYSTSPSRGSDEVSAAVRLQEDETTLVSSMKPTRASGVQITETRMTSSHDSRQGREQTSVQASSMRSPSTQSELNERRRDVTTMQPCNKESCAPEQSISICQGTSLVSILKPIKKYSVSKGSCHIRASSGRIPRNTSMPSLSTYTIESNGFLPTTSSSVQGGSSSSATVDARIGNLLNYYESMVRYDAKESKDEYGSSGSVNSYSLTEAKEMYNAYCAKESKDFNDSACEVEDEKDCGNGNSRVTPATRSTTSASSGEVDSSHHSRSVQQCRRLSVASQHDSFECSPGDGSSVGSGSNDNSDCFDTSTMALRDESDGWGLHFDGDDFSAPLGTNRIPIPYSSQHSSSNTSKTSAATESTMNSSTSEYYLQQYQDLVDDCNGGG
eukprot:CAMPEP_0181085430 /NCGR_PEP_ID=MMETSP1071-20121207/5226_1 /TAXON_ID=35127 /ORGANISM="Thalassiosira sp., Strain NH16" /LENGTH=509 /DNA_ID=CAMNT_0023167233 /DNA_START=44 /DNA_END=1569 /DNA_ORIENTATION=-